MLSCAKDTGNDFKLANTKEEGGGEEVEEEEKHSKHIINILLNSILINLSLNKQHSFQFSPRHFIPIFNRTAEAYQLYIPKTLINMKITLTFVLYPRFDQFNFNILDLTHLTTKFDCCHIPHASI